MKRFATFLLAMVMIMSLALPVFAATNNSITVNKAKAGETYKLYKMFDLKVDNEKDPKAYTYTVNADWADFFGEGGAGAAYINVNELGAVTAVSDAAALAKAASDWVEEEGITAVQTIEANSETVVFAGLEDGYWLITSTLGTLAMIETTPDKDAVSVVEKNSNNTIEKMVQEDSTNEFGKSNDAQVGDTVYFKSTVTIVKNTRNVVVHDQMDKGLTFTGDVTIEGLTEGTEYELVVSPDDGHTFDIIFDQDWIDALDFGNDGVNSYVITYTAILNENAVVKDENGVALVDQENETYVSFGESSESTHDTTHTHAHMFSVYKHASGSNAHLAGAVFQLKKAGVVVKLVKLDDNNYRVATAADGENAVDSFITVDTDVIKIWGVDADSDYSLLEIEAPDGYNKLKDEIPVSVDTGNTTRVSVENKAGTELPSTGGVGTTMFYLFGGVMVLAAVVLLVTKKRMANAE